MSRGAKGKIGKRAEGVLGVKRAGVSRGTGVRREARDAESGPNSIGLIGRAWGGRERRVVEKVRGGGRGKVAGGTQKRTLDVKALPHRC